MGNVTLKKLAELSGFSVRTVSRVLKNQANVTTEKREMILKLARDLHYTPNIAARNLRLSRSNIVGILCENYGQEIAIQKLYDLERQLGACGYYPLLGHYADDPVRLGKLLSDWTGLTEFAVVVNAIPEEMCLRIGPFCANSPMRFIFVDLDGGPNCHSLMIDRTGGICEAVTRLIRTGRRRIAHCGKLESRKIGFSLAFEKFSGPDRPESLHLESDFEFKDGASCADWILENNVDAVFFDTDRMALGFMSRASELGISIPEKVAVIGFDDDPGGRTHHPSLSTVAHPVSEMNREIVKIIRCGTECPVVRRTFPTKFIQRASS